MRSCGLPGVRKTALEQIGREGRTAVVTGITHADKITFLAELRGSNYRSVYFFSAARRWRRAKFNFICHFRERGRTEGHAALSRSRGPKRVAVNSGEKKEREEEIKEGEGREQGSLDTKERLGAYYRSRKWNH